MTAKAPIETNHLTAQIKLWEKKFQNQTQTAIYIMSIFQA